MEVANVENAQLGAQTVIPVFPWVACWDEFALTLCQELHLFFISNHFCVPTVAKRGENYPETHRDDLPFQR